MTHTFRPSRRHHRSSPGQALTELAIVLPILLLLVGGIVQYGALIATKHALTQISRDVGRWAATQDYDPDASGTCRTEAVAANEPLKQADATAQQSSMMGYAAGMWNDDNFVVYADGAVLPETPPFTEGVEVVWSGDPCPTMDNTETAWVTIRVTHRAPVLLPGFPYLPGVGTCDGSGCYLAVNSTGMFRMEPPTVEPVAGS